MDTVGIDRLFRVFGTCIRIKLTFSSFVFLGPLFVPWPFRAEDSPHGPSGTDSTHCPRGAVLLGAQGSSGCGYGHGVRTWSMYIPFGKLTWLRKNHR